MKNVVITILALLVLGLGGYLVYDKVIDKKDTKCENVSNEQTDLYTYSDIKGTYEYKTEIDYMEERVEATATLLLYENGTFYYFGYGSGKIGNYIIEGNKVKLNTIFKFGNGMVLEPEEGSELLTINSNNTLTKTTLDLGGNTFNNVSLEKTTNSVNKEFKKLIDNNKYIVE